jgi:ABC-type iron transport system FetAB ATPase subunit
MLQKLFEKERTLVRRNKVAFIFQFFNLIPTLTVKENLLLPLELIGTENPTERINSILSEVGLANRANTYPDKLSGGEQRRIAIARAPDFYTPGLKNTMLYQSVYLNLLKDKNPQWLGKLDVIHNYIYSKDMGKALALLGNTEDAYNQVWHLPTTEEKLTSRQ